MMPAARPFPWSRLPGQNGTAAVLGSGAIPSRSVVSHWLHQVSRLSLVGGLTLVGTLAAVMVASADTWFVDAELTQLLETQAAARATDHVQLAMLGRVTAQDFAAPHSLEKMAQMGERLRLVLSAVRRTDSDIVGADILAADGTVLASDMESWSARQPSARSDSAFQVSVPIVIDQQVVGAYKIYEDARAVQRLRAEALVLVIAALAGMLGGLAISLSRRWRRPAGRRSQRSASTLAAATSQTELASAGQPLVIRKHNQAIVPVLTARQLEVLRLLATQRSYHDIAIELVVSEETVRSHVKRILHKLQQPTRTQAVVAAVKAGLLDLS